MIFILVLQEDDKADTEDKNHVKNEKQDEKQEPTETIIQYIFDEDTEDQVEPVQSDQYTVVNISDVSAYQNEHTVIEDQNRILSTTQNEDGTTTYMVSTESGEEINQYDGKTVFFLRLPDNNEENS